MGRRVLYNFHKKQNENNGQKKGCLESNPGMDSFWQQIRVSRLTHT